MEFDHLHIYSAAPEESLAFFQRCFDAQRLGSLGAADGRRNHLIMLGGQTLAISHFPPSMQAAHPPEIGDGALRSGWGVAHFGLNVTDLAAALRRFEDAGVVVHDQPQTAGSIRYVYVSAPDGVVIEVTEYEVARALKPVLAVYRRATRLSQGLKRQLTLAFLKSSRSYQA